MQLSKIFLTGTLVLFTLGLFAQKTATFSGTILEESSKETIIGANVSFMGSSLGATTDFDGMFIVRGIPAGSYDIEITSIGLEAIVLKNVTFAEGEAKTLNIVMKEATQLLNEVTIVEYKKTNTEAAVLLEVKNAKSVVSAISSQQITKSQDNNAAQVMQRVPGVTIVENRFVMIRGLSERYNNVMINNVIAPSTEVNRRTFSFDLISSGSLDRMMIYKSGAPDLPGDFAGGVIKIFTVDNVEENFTNVKLGLGYRVGTTGRDFYQSEGSATDFLGFDNGFRRLPGDFMSTRRFQNLPRNAQERRTEALKLENNWDTQKTMAMPNYSLGFGLGRTWKLSRGRTLSTINTIDYSSSYQTYQRDFFRYFEWEDRDQPILKRFQFEDNVNQKDARISILSVWNYRINDKHRIKFKNLFNQIGENETILRSGEDFIQRPLDDLKSYLLGYRSRSIYSGQMEGTHELRNENEQLNWVIGGSYLREIEPDLRRFRTYRRKNDEGNFTIIDPPSSNLFDTGRYFGSLNEFSVNHGLSYNNAWNNLLEGLTVKAGYYADYRRRQFDSRYFSFLYPGFSDPRVLDSLSRLPLDQVFAPDNIQPVNGWVMEEGTRPIDSYTAFNALGAGYVGFELPISRFNINGGLRTEYNILGMTSRDDFGPIEVNNPVLSFLPFLNTGYSINAKNIIRLAYGRTVNRPEFRELAPFLFYDYNLAAGRIGNPNLQSATIDNLDLRYEMYPRPGETFSIGAFYKYFTNPIENRTIVTTEEPQFSYINSDMARNYGLELELRKSFKGMTNSAFIDNFSINANASLIFSEVDLGEGVAQVQDRFRPLQGQSPYIVNTALYYEDVDHGLSISAVYNVFGSRIFSVGDVNFPMIYELPRNSMDISIRKTFGRVTYKLGVQDIFNARYRFYQDSNRDNKITGDDHAIFTHRLGQLINLTATYKL
jgi:outer membrane receptor for ferrienterochelin and colicin